jgi:hypothetical protein
MGGRERDEEIEDKKRWKRKGKKDTAHERRCLTAAVAPPRVLFRVRFRE